MGISLTFFAQASLEQRSSHLHLLHSWDYRYGAPCPARFLTFKSICVFFWKANFPFPLGIREKPQENGEKSLD
jgi:hypothetical protein